MHIDDLFPYLVARLEQVESICKIFRTKPSLGLWELKSAVNLLTL